MNRLQSICVAVVFFTLACHAMAADRRELRFDGNRAFSLLRRQCEFGPRAPGMPSREKAIEFYIETFRDAGLQPVRQEFVARPQLIGGQPVPLVNIIAALGPVAKGSVIVSAHWDTRPVGEKDPNPIMAMEPIIGANDGASGVAVVLELARIFAEKPLEYGLVFALLDGEDLGGAGIQDEWCLGSKYLAGHLDPGWNVKMAVNIDMVGDRDQAFTQETYGEKIAPEFNEFCWAAAASTAPLEFLGMDRRNVLDDHISFLRAGIPAFNLIDMSYPHWHTQADTVDKCSAKSLRVAGRAVEAILLDLQGKPWDFSVGPLPHSLRDF